MEFEEAMIIDDLPAPILDDFMDTDSSRDDEEVDMEIDLEVDEKYEVELDLITTMQCVLIELVGRERVLLVLAQAPPPSSFPEHLSIK